MQPRASASSHRKTDRRTFSSIFPLWKAGLSTLSENQTVSFDLERGNNGKTSAVNLKAV